MKVLSPELAIGGRADANFLLLPDQLSDVLIFKLLQVFVGQLPLVCLLPRLQELLGA